MHAQIIRTYDRFVERNKEHFFIRRWIEMTDGVFLNICVDRSLNENAFIIKAQVLWFFFKKLDA